MSAPLDWYFDFISPFSYLQCEQLPALETRIRIRYRPVLFAGLLKALRKADPARTTDEASALEQLGRARS